MDAPSWRKAKELLAAGLMLPTADRPDFLGRECADPALREEIARLLETGTSADTLDELLAPLLDSHLTAIAPGEQIGRYVVVEQIGAGGMGTVYRARDPRLGRDVALKVICGDASPASIRRFTREAQAASALSHRNIITVFDVGESEYGPFIVMEIVEGRTLRAIMNRAPDVDSSTRIGLQIARALAAAHTAGIVHRDIKPENVMVRNDGHVKVLDFGICRIIRRPVAAGADTTTRPGPTTGGTVDPTAGAIVGTAAYMSPEQARGDPVEASTDIFALGVVFYELFSGRHPFAAADEIARLARLLSDTPPPPSKYAPGLRSALDVLILRMLDKEPRARPVAVDVEEVLADLVGERGGVAPRGPAPVEPRRTVGHEPIRAELLDAFERADAGHGSVVALSGEPGIGKTTLAEDFVREILAGRRRIVFGRGRCSERLAEAGAYLPWLEALETMRDEAGRPVSRMLQTLAPAWHAQVVPHGPAEVSISALLSVGSQEWMKRELAAFLEGVSQQRTVVLFFDDVQWADVSTIDLIAHLGTRLASMRVLMLVAYRPTDLLLSRHPFLNLKLDLQARGVCRDIEIGFLSESDVARYLAVEFPRHEFPATLAPLVHAKTEGNPLFMTDLLRALSDRRVLDQQDGVWRLTQAVTAFENDLPASIRAMIDLKIAKLAEADRSLLVVASVQGYEFDSAVAAAALGRDQGDVEEHLDALGRVHALVRPVREVQLPDGRLTVQYRFVHALYQNALYATLGPSRRASLSAAVARAILEHHIQSPANASELALLFEAARDFRHAAQFFMTASGRARQIFADREAILLARRALTMVRSMPDTADRVPLEFVTLMGVAVPYFAIGEFASAEAAELLQTARQLAGGVGDLPQVFTLVAVLHTYHFMRGELREAVPYIGEMSRLAERVGDPLMAIWAEWAYGATYSHLGERLEDSLEHLERGARIYTPTMHPDLVVMTAFDAGLGCHFQAARLLWLLGYPDRAIERVNRAVALARDCEHPMNLQFTRFFEAWIRQYRREPAEALRVTSEVLPAIEQYGYKIVRGWTQIINGWAVACTGDARRGEQLLRDAIAASDTIGIRMWQPNALALLAEAVALQNRTDEALALLDEALTIAKRTDEHFYSSELHRYTAELLMQRDAHGSADRIEQLLHTAIVIARQQGARSFQLRAATTLARYFEARGRIAEARAALGEIVSRFHEGSATPDVSESRALLDHLS